MRSVIVVTRPQLVPIVAVADHISIAMPMNRLQKLWNTLTSLFQNTDQFVCHIKILCGVIEHSGFTIFANVDCIPTIIVDRRQW